MKNIIILTLVSAFQIFFCYASVPISWTVDMTRAKPATFEAYQGESIAFEATLTAGGKPFEAPSNYSFFWQTNGMGNVYWEAKAKVEGEQRRGDSTVGLGPSTSPTNVLFATWYPTYDVGAKVYKCFIGSPSNNYHTAFQLRLHPSPGATPNVLPLPTPVIDFAKVRVLNPPWEGGGGVNTNAVIDIIHETVSGSARSLPKYLHALSYDDSYREDAEWYYSLPQPYGHCSSVRDGNVHARNYDWKLDEAAEFVVRMSAGPGRHASVGIANCGTNLTEEIVTSGEWRRFYKCLPGRVVDGINDAGVVINVNVVGGDPHAGGWRTDGDIPPQWAVRWTLDNAASAEYAATNLAGRIAFPKSLKQNFHYMISDERETWIVENGVAYKTEGRAALANFPLYPSRQDGEGQERYDALMAGANITSQWWTLTYMPDGYRKSDLPGMDDEQLKALFEFWGSRPKEAHRGETVAGENWWQSVHTSVFDITNRTLRVAVQEIDDWYTFQVPVTAPKIDAYTKAETDAKLAEKIGGGEVPSFEQDPTATDKAKAEILAQGLDRAVKTNEYGYIENGNISVGDWRLNNERGLEYNEEINIKAEYYPDDGYLRMGEYRPEESEFKFFAHTDELSGFVPYEGAMHDVNIGWNSFVSDAPAYFYSVNLSGTDYQVDCIYPVNGAPFYFPWSESYGEDTTHDFALVSQIEDATNGLAQTIPQKINAAVSANLNTYIDGETGVEYVGKFYGGSLYYVPTGNVYPPNN